MWFMYIVLIYYACLSSLLDRIQDKRDTIITQRRNQKRTKISINNLCNTWRRHPDTFITRQCITVFFKSLSTHY